MATVTCVNATTGGNGVVVPVGMAGKTYQLIPFFFTAGALIANGNTAVFQISTGGRIENFTPPQMMSAAGAVLATVAHTYVLSQDGKKLTITAAADIPLGTEFFTYLILGSY